MKAEVAAVIEALRVANNAAANWKETAEQFRVWHNAQEALVARLVAKLRAIPDDDDAAIVALRDDLLADLAPTPSQGKDATR